jgi:hypothetical protein
MTTLAPSSSAAAAARAEVSVNGRPRSLVGTLAAPENSTAMSMSPTRSATSLTAAIEALSPLRYTVGTPGPDNTKPVTSQLM